MAAKAEREDLDDFLSRVNEVEGLVRDIATSRDPDSITSALQNADEFLTKDGRARGGSTSSSSLDDKDSGGVVGFNRTVINPGVTLNPPITNSSASDGAPSSSPLGNNSFNSEHEAFCRALEEDAQERAERRDKRLQLGKVLKCQGNEAFRDEQYQKALTCYSDAIEQLPGDTTLYTNRALVYLKLERYDDVIKDCDAALKFNDKCLKAYLYKGKSFINNGRNNEARDCFQTALVKMPDKESIIKSYIKNIENWDCDL